MAEEGAPRGQADSSKELRQRLASLSPEELEQVRSYAWDRLLRARKVNVDGKQMSMKALAEEVKKQRHEFSMGMYDDSSRSIPRSEAQQLVPSRFLRPGSEKQMLRAQEEEALELQRMGTGNCFTTRKLLGLSLPGPQRNFAYGIFARPDRVKQFLGSEWTDKDPNEVLENPNFYLDILRRCHQLELTLMVLTSRHLPLAAAQPVVQGALHSSMERLQGGKPLVEEDASALKNFVQLFDEKRLSNSGWVENGNVQKGTHIIISATPQAGIAAEAITPGTLAQRKTSFIGTAQNPLLTAAVFGLFLGNGSFDKVGKEDVGTGVLWAANGLSFTRGKSGKQTIGVAGKDGKMELNPNTTVVALPATTSIFKLLTERESTSPMLVNRIALGAV